MAKDVRELTGADLFEAAFGERPTGPLTIEVWNERLSQEKILESRFEGPKCPSCKGDGRVAWDEPCTDCLGSGKAEGGPYISDETFVREYAASFPAPKKP